MANQDECGVLWTDTGQLVWNVHPARRCEGRGCWVHHPSSHHMTEWPIHLRRDKGYLTVERICAHGVGHPDPDDVAFNASLGRHVSFHGCDGCCGTGQQVVVDV